MADAILITRTEPGSLPKGVAFDRCNDTLSFFVRGQPVGHDMRDIVIMRLDEPYFLRQWAFWAISSAESRDRYCDLAVTIGRRSWNWRIHDGDYYTYIATEEEIVVSRNQRFTARVGNATHDGIKVISELRVTPVTP